MFTSTPVVAAITLILAGSVAFLANPPAGPAQAPGAEMAPIDPAEFGGFSGTMACAIGRDGEITDFEWGTLTRGETYPRCTIEASDPRMSGNNYSVHDYYKYDRRPSWGVRSVGNVVTNEEGTWVSEEHWGYQHPEDGTMLYAARYRGTGEYEGLSALAVLSQDTFGLSFDVEGVIFPGELPEAPAPPIEAALAAD